MNPVIYVFDAHAINATGRQSHAPLIFDVLYDLICESLACFPDEVVEELKRLAKGEFTYSWVKAAASSRFDKGAAYKHYQAVTSLVPDLVDDYAEYESSAACVLAQARSLTVVGHEVKVVTEDIRTKPTRICLAEACDRLEMPWCTLQQCLVTCGHGNLWKN